MVCSRCAHTGPSEIHDEVVTASLAKQTGIIKAEDVSKINYQEKLPAAEKVSCGCLFMTFCISSAIVHGLKMAISKPCIPAILALAATCFAAASLNSVV